MPELPEVETIRLSLQKNLIGKTIEAVNILEKKLFVGNPKKIIGKKITALSRKGKVLSIKAGKFYLNIHLKLTGQLLFSVDRDNSVFKNIIPRANTHKMPGKSTRVILYFTDNSALYFNDLRKFGWIRLLDRLEENNSIDILSPNFTLTYFANSISKTRKPIKNVLLEQDKFTGIGNIYANDALWKALIHPLRSTNTLSDVEVGELYRSIKSVIAEGVKYKGSSAQDEMYLLPDSSKGGYQNHMKVYGRERLPCLRCKTPIKRIKHGGRSSFYCPKCQTIS